MSAWQIDEVARVRGLIYRGGQGAKWIVDPHPEPVAIDVISTNIVPAGSDIVRSVICIEAPIRTGKGIRKIDIGTGKSTDL